MRVGTLGEKTTQKKATNIGMMLFWIHWANTGRKTFSRSLGEFTWLPAETAQLWGNAMCEGFEVGADLAEKLLFPFPLILFPLLLLLSAS